MNQQDTQYKTWLEQYANGTISPSDKGLLMEAIADGRVDDLLNDELEAQWAADIHAGVAQGAPLPFEQSAVFRQLSHGTDKVRTPSSSPRRWGWVAAAAVTGLLFLAALWTWKPWDTQEGAMLARIPSAYLHQTNAGASPRNIQLPDGSVVTLLPGATVHYPARFAATAREVYLEGDAFFEVTHMDGMRFSVHGRAVSAEVLGTSFWVRQDEAGGRSEVEVRTGKVRVQANNEDQEANNSPVVVLPNQQVAYLEGKGQLQLMLADSLLPLHTPEAMQILQDQQALRFDKATRLEDVLVVLSRVYGVDIQLSSPNLNNCLVTGDLSRQDLLKSIEMICLSIGATFERRDTNILIAGQGCSLH